MIFGPVRKTTIQAGTISNYGQSAYTSHQGHPDSTLVGTIVIHRPKDDRKQHKSAPLLDVFIPRVTVRDVGVGVVCARMPRQRSVRQWMSYPQAHS